jgi:hypothetical protein
MPSTTRGNIKQKLDYAMRDLTNSQSLIIDVTQPFETVHPEYFDAFCVLVKALEELKNSIKILSDKI